MTSEYTPMVLLAHDGELEDVRELLSELDMEFKEIGDKQPSRGRPEAVQLLVSTPRHVLALERGLWSVRFQTQIVIAEGSSRTLQARLERGSCDFVVMRPVHPTALKLLLLHGLYQGPEKRRRARVAIGAKVKLRVGGRTRAAELLQLSQGGCGLVTSPGLETGASVELLIPKELAEAPLSLPARVVREGVTQVEGECELGLAFESLSAGVRGALRGVMKRHAVGSASLENRTPQREQTVSTPKAPVDTVESRPAEDAGSDAERRGGQRKQFVRPVLAGGCGSAHSLMGRDLSTGGMRVAANSDLVLGDELKLALYGHGGQPRVLVKARVARDDGTSGWFLQFCGVSVERAAALTRLVESLPILAPPSRADKPPVPVVVSEIVEPE